MKNTRTAHARILAAAVVALLLSPARSTAHHPEGLTLDQLTRRASVVVEGQVTAVNSAWNAAATQIHTTVTLRVGSYYKGDLRRNVLQIRMLGGTVGNMTMAVLGQPTFALNEQVTLFLKPNFEERDVPFVGASEGKFRVARDPVTGQDFLANGHLRVSKVNAVETIERIMRPVLQAMNAGGAKEE